METVGGEMNLNPLRINRKAVDFVRVGIRKAGGNWMDREVVNDNGLATSRHGKKVLCRGRASPAGGGK